MPEKKARFSMESGVMIKKVRDKNVSFVDDQDNKTLIETKNTMEG